MPVIESNIDPRSDAFRVNSETMVSLVSELELPNERRLTVINCHGLNFVTEAKFRSQLDRVFSVLGGGQANSAANSRH